MNTKVNELNQTIADKEHALNLAIDKHSAESKALQKNIDELQALRDKLNKELDDLNLRIKQRGCVNIMMLSRLMASRPF